MLDAAALHCVAALAPVLAFRAKRAEVNKSGSPLGSSACRVAK